MADVRPVISLITLLWLTPVAKVAWGQVGVGRETLPDFEAVSIRNVPSTDRSIHTTIPPDLLPETGRFEGGPGTSSPRRINYVGVTLKGLLMRAYDLGRHQISGPDWISQEQYNLMAVLPPDLDNARFMVMLRRLLSTAFSIKSHSEFRNLRVYVLTVAKSGPNLKPAEAPPESSAPVDQLSALQQRLQSRITGRTKPGNPGMSRSVGMASGTVQEFAELLSKSLSTPVVDKTGIEGVYSLSLSWKEENSLSLSSAPGEPGGNSDASGPSVFVAIQEQLGLKLEPTKALVEVLVLDQASKTPAVQ